MKNLRLVPISISAFLPLYLCCDSRKVHLVAGREVKNWSARAFILFCVALCSGCRRTHPCSCHLRGRRRRRQRPPGADGESIVMDQRASRPQPWVSECREQRQLFTPPSLFINAPPPPDPSVCSALILLFHLENSTFSLSSALRGGILRQRERERRVTWPFLPWCLLASVSGWLGNLWNVAIDDQAVKQFD